MNVTLPTKRWALMRAANCLHVVPIRSNGETSHTLNDGGQCFCYPVQDVEDARIWIHEELN